MRIKRFLQVSALTALTATAVIAGPGGGPGGGGPGGPGGGGPGGPGPGPVSAGPGSPGAMQRDRAQIHATEQDRLRIQASLDASAQVRNRAREMRQAASGAGYGAEQARRNRDQVRSEFQALEQRHGALVSGLSAADRDRVRDRLHDMDAIRDRVRERLRELDAECDKDAPDRDRLREQTRDIARDMKRLESEYKDLAET